MMVIPTKQVPANQVTLFRHFQHFAIITFTSNKIIVVRSHTVLFYCWLVICEICNCRIGNPDINDMTNKQSFDIYLKYKAEYSY